MKKILIFSRTSFWDNYFTGIRKKCHYFNTLLTKPNRSPSKGNPYNKQPRCYLLNSCFVVNLKSEQIVETSIETLQKNLKEHLETTIHSSGRVLTGLKTAHDFDEQKLTELQGFRNELHTLITSLCQLQETCKAAFRHPFSAMKRKSRSKWLWATQLGKCIVSKQWQFWCHRLEVLIRRSS